MEAAERAEQEEEAAADEPAVELEEIIAEVDAAEAAEAAEAEKAEPAEGETAEPGEAEAKPEAEPEPDWRADADAALADE
jgi:hypothetical protein